VVFVAPYQEIMLSVVYHTFLKSRIVRQVVGLVYGVCCDVLAFSRLFERRRSPVGGYGKQFLCSEPLMTIWNACTGCHHGLQR